jgi:hypothetical protein
VKFKIDENLPSELAVDLRDLGHEADVFDESLAGAKDPVLLEVASSENSRLTVVGPTRIRVR